MAKPIEPTPILEGEDKSKFLSDLSSLKYDEKKEKFLKECDEIFSKINNQIE
jgi:hypothetical protein